MGYPSRNYILYEVVWPSLEAMQDAPGNVEVRTVEAGITLAEARELVRANEVIYRDSTPPLPIRHYIRLAPASEVAHHSGTAHPRQLL